MAKEELKIEIQDEEVDFKTQLLKVEAEKMSYVQESQQLTHQVEEYEQQIINLK